MGARIPKPQFYAIVEQAYAEGIGARRLERMIGYSYTHIRTAARILELPKLPRYVPYSVPSPKLLLMISAVAHLKVDDTKHRSVKSNLPVAAFARPEES